MPLSKCRICGKYVPNPYRRYHEKVSCLRMRLLRGDPDVVHRVLLPRVKIPEKKSLPNGQKRLLEHAHIKEGKESPEKERGV